MSRLRLKISMSLDGFVAGPRQSVADPLGVGGMRLHDWVVPLATTRLPGTSSLTVPLGHSSLVVSEEVYRRVVNTLRPPHDHLIEELPATD